MGSNKYCEILDVIMDEASLNCGIDAIRHSVPFEPCNITDVLGGDSAANVQIEIPADTVPDAERVFVDCQEALDNTQIDGIRIEPGDELHIDDGMQPHFYVRLREQSVESTSK